jgi:hypothetical protein
MFWYAAGRAEALERGWPLHLNTNWHTRHGGKHRPFLLDRFALADAPDVTFGPDGGGLIDDPRIGCPDIFEPFAEQLRRDFAIPDAPAPTDDVGIHVRRGDYAAVRPDGALMISAERLKAAMAHFPGRRFSIFSNDVAWCEEHLVGDAVTVMTPGDPVRDMARLASCSDLIIANSSFSWWAAWLGRRPGKAILYPRNWHNGAWPGRPDPNGQARLIGADWIAY